MCTNDVKLFGDKNLKIILSYVKCIKESGLEEFFSFSELFFFFYLLGPHLWHMVVPRLGVK